MMLDLTRCGAKLEVCAPNTTQVHFICYAYQLESLLFTLEQL